MKNLLEKIKAAIKKMSESRKEKWSEARREDVNLRSLEAFNIVPSRTDGMKYSIVANYDVVGEYATAEEAVESLMFMRRKYVERKTENKKLIWY